MIAFCLYILMGLSSFGCHCEASVITVPPVSVVAPIYTTATFICEGTGDILNWWIQSAPLTDSIAQQREIKVITTTNNDYSSVLTVNAIPDNDDLAIGCEVITFNPFNRTVSNSELTIRGVSLVQDLKYNFATNNSLLIKWLSPVYFSYDIPVGSPVSYQVLVTDEEDGDIILDTTTPDTNITVPNITECDTFNISVTALVGEYISVNNTVSKYNGSYSVNVIEDSIESVSIKVSSMPSPHCERKLFVTNEYDDSILVDDEITSVDDKSVPLKPHKKYRLSTEVKNLRDKVKDIKYNDIYTYSVKNILVSTEGNGSVILQCIYVPESTADGCRVTFTHTTTGKNESFTILGSNDAIVSLSTSGVYNVTAYDNVNGSFYGPAVNYPRLVEVVKVTPSTSISSSITSESTPPPQSTVSSTVSPTVTETPGVGTTSSTRENDANSVVPVVVGILGGIVLVILIIAVCVGITVCKRKKMKLQVLIHSDIATIQRPQAETNQYQDVHELRLEVPIATSPILLTYNRPIDEENPYRVTRSEFLHDNHDTIPSHSAMGQMMPQSRLPHSSQTSATTQEAILEDRISTTLNNNIHDNAYTTETPTAADTTVAVNDTDNATADNEATNDTPATVAPTYASIAKRTDTTPLPAVDQRVTYDTVTGDINKRGGGVTVYSSDNISTIPPPPSYADTIAQECGECAAVVHGKYGKHPPTYTGDEYGSKTLVQNQTNN